MTISAEAPDPRKCSRYVKPFLEETKHAKGPASAASNEWVNFGVAEAGQLELANRDKKLADQVLTICEEENQAALDRAAKRAKPWYRRIF